MTVNGDRINMNRMLMTLLFILYGSAGCNLLDSDDDSAVGPPNLLRNGSFELWQGGYPSYWNHTPLLLGVGPVNDTPPGGGQRSVIINTAPTIQPQGLFQTVAVPDSAGVVSLSFWAEGPHGPVYFRVKTPTATYTSDTLVNFFQMAGWYQYSMSLPGTVHVGDSITVHLSGRGTYDIVNLSLGD